jgi:hypothetical protein
MTVSELVPLVEGQSSILYYWYAFKRSPGCCEKKKEAQEHLRDFFFSAKMAHRKLKKYNSYDKAHDMRAEGCTN